MKIAAISDTHGDLGLINAIARESEADAVLHAGDFGFYDDQSVARLSHSGGGGSSWWERNWWWVILLIGFFLLTQKK